MAQEATADRQTGYLRRCHTWLLQRSGVKSRHTLNFVIKTVSFLFLTLTQDNQTRRSKADCGSQRHPRPSRIISALEQSILLAWGLNAEEKSNLGELEGNCKGKQNPNMRHTFQSERFTSAGGIPLTVCNECIPSAGCPPFWIHIKTTDIHYLYSKQKGTQHIDYQQKLLRCPQCAYGQVVKTGDKWQGVKTGRRIDR